MWNNLSPSDCLACTSRFVLTGVEDDGFPRGLTEADLEQSLTTLRAMAAEVHATAAQVRALPGSSGRSCAVLRVHRICRNEVSYVDLRIAGAHPVPLAHVRSLKACACLAQQYRPFLC